MIVLVLILVAYSVPPFEAGFDMTGGFLETPLPALASTNDGAPWLLHE